MCEPRICTLSRGMSFVFCTLSTITSLIKPPETPLAVTESGNFP